MLRDENSACIVVRYGGGELLPSDVLARYQHTNAVPDFPQKYLHWENLDLVHPTVVTVVDTYKKTYVRRSLFDTHSCRSTTSTDTTTHSTLHLMSQKCRSLRQSPYHFPWVAFRTSPISKFSLSELSRNIFDKIYIPYISLVYETITFNVITKNWNLTYSQKIKFKWI